MPPLAVSLGSECYPADEEILAVIKKKTADYYIVDGIKSAIELGNVKTLNIFMLGCLSCPVPLEENAWKESIAQSLPPKVLVLNMRAFEQGRQAILHKKAEKNNG